MFLEKVDVRSIIKDHAETLRDYGTQKRSAFDLFLFFIVPAAIAGVAVWRGIRIRATAVNGILAAAAIFVGLLPNLLLLVLTFLQTARGDSSDPFVRLRKQFLREIAVNVSFCLLVSIALVTTSLFALIGLPTDDTPIGSAPTFLLIAGSGTLVLTLLMVMRRIYALILNEFDRHKIDRAA